MPLKDDMARLLAEGKRLRASQVQRELQVGEQRQSSRTLIGLLFAVILIGVTVVLIYGLSAVGLIVLNRAEPILDAAVAPAAPLLFSPTALALVGLVVLLVGLPLARKFQRPGRFRNGITAVALSLGTFWPLQLLASRVDVSFWEWRAMLHLLAGFISICLLTGGLELIRMANNTARDDSWEFLK
jgi:hypothetical protein